MHSAIVEGDGGGEEQRTANAAKRRAFGHPRSLASSARDGFVGTFARTRELHPDHIFCLATTRQLENTGVCRTWWGIHVSIFEFKYQAGHFFFVTSTVT